MICDFISNFQLDGNKVVNPREGKEYEFKESFNWENREDYAKIMASFANSQGGYLLFGIKDDGSIVGLSNNKFENIDSAKISTYLNSFFVPEILWEKGVCELGGYNIGVINVKEAREKPIISNKPAEQFKEGDIFFRYNAQSQRIKYSNLKQIIDDEKRKYGEKLLNSLKLINEKGPDSVKILDMNEIKDANNDDIYLIDNSDPEIRVHKASENEPIKGIGIKIINIEDKAIPINIEKYRNINSELIVRAFLDQTLPPNFNPIGFVERLAVEGSGYVPVYFYIKEANLTKDEAIELIKKTKSISKGKTKLIKRLSGEEDKKLRLTKHSDMLDNLINGSLNINDLQPSSVKTVLQSIRSCSKEFLEQNWNSLKDIMWHLYDKYYMDNKFRTEVRLAICFIDWSLFFNSV